MPKQVQEQLQELAKVGDSTSYIRLRATHDALVWNQIYTKLTGKRFCTRTPRGTDHHRNRPYQEQILRDDAQRIVYYKSRQAGMSEVEIRRVFWNLDNRPGLNWVYTFPRKILLNNFVATRVEQFLQNCPRLKKALNTETNSRGLKGFRNGSNVYFLSAWDKELGESVAADGVTFDERDRMRAQVDIAFQESMTSSKRPIRIDLSTPTVPGFGVAAIYEHSTQTQWHIQCSKCGHKQTLSYPESIKQVKDLPNRPVLTAQDVAPGTYQYVCKKCGANLDERLDRWDGEWVSARTDPAIEIHGYAINQMMCCWITADQVMRKKIEYKFESLWRNYVLGEAFAGEGRLLTATDLIRCYDPSLPYGKRPSDITHVYAGIDWGDVNWVTVLGLRRDGRLQLLYVFWEKETGVELEATNRIASRLVPFNPSLIIADTGYGADRIPVLRTRFPGKVYGCHYPNVDQSSVLTPVWSENQWKVTVDRTISLRETTHQFQQHSLVLPVPDKYRDAYTYLEQHLCNLALVRELNEKDEMVQWIASTGPDHLAHSLNYARIGSTHERYGKQGSSSFDWTWLNL